MAKSYKENMLRRQLGTVHYRNEKDEKTFFRCLLKSMSGPMSLEMAWMGKCVMFIKSVGDKTV